MLAIINGDITKLPVDAIVNAANARGIMGAGVAGAIAKAGGKEISDEAMKICSKYNFGLGSAYFTGAGQLSSKYVIHAVTMKNPGERSSLGVVIDCLESIFKRAAQLGCQVISIPGLGTKIGRVPTREVAEVFWSLIPVYEKQYGVNSFICDIDKEFTEALVTLNRKR